MVQLENLLLLRSIEYKMYIGRLIKMVQLKLMEEKDAKLIIEWNGSDMDFLMQWSNFEYPLTKRQIIDRIKLE